jgi:hypothetical protein
MGGFWMSWQSEYVQKTSGFALIFVSLVLGFTGLIFTLVVHPLIGALVLLLAVSLPWLIRYWSQDQKVTCTPDGFSVETLSRRTGSARLTYLWHEVTATRYQETKSRDSDGSKTTGWFEVETTAGKVMRLSDRTTRFREMIELFNAMTPHLPYEWKQQRGAAMGYLLVARAPVEDPIQPLRPIVQVP